MHGYLKINNMIKEISHCSECPFENSSIDFDSTSPYYMTCNLQIEQEEDLIFYGDLEDEIQQNDYNIPEWCKLKDGYCTVRIKDD